MRVIVACEFSGAVRDAFRARGHEAVSCDLLPTEAPGPHIQSSIFDLDVSCYDLLIGFPPCTAICLSGNRWYANTQARLDAVDFVRRMWELPVPRVALENPRGVLPNLFRRPDQVIQPWQFGHGETKATCLWLRGLPHLRPTRIVSGRQPRVHFAAPGPMRWKERSRTLDGVAAAMADQWGSIGSGLGWPGEQIELYAPYPVRP